MLCRLLITLLVPLLTSTTVAAAADYRFQRDNFQVPLTLRDNSGVARDDWPVASGLPLPVGWVNATDELRLTDAEGNTLPCQFRVLSRYTGQDNSVRWVLLQFQADVPANGLTHVYLRNDRPAGPVADGIRVNESAEAIVVDTGRIRARIPRHDGRLLESVALDGEPVLTGRTGDGPWLRSGEVDTFQHFTGRGWNTHGWKRNEKLESIHVAEAEYRAGMQAPRAVEIEEAGPLYTVVRIEGRHSPTESGAGIREQGFYNFTTRLHFYRDKGFIEVEHSIDNSEPGQPLWMLMFHAAGLRHGLDLAGPLEITAGGLDAKGNRRRQTGPGTQSPQWLYQNEPTEEQPYGGRTFAVSGGYRFGTLEDAAITPVARGEQARYLDISNAERGVSIAMRYFWEQGPRALVATPEGFEVHLLADSPGAVAPADGSRPEYDLDYGERTIHDALYYFHAGDAQQADVAAVAEAFEYPLMAHAPTDWYARTNTWYFEISPQPGEPSVKGDPHEHWQPPHVGYREHGVNRGYNSGGHHASLNSAWLGYLRSGSLQELERNLAESRWTISHNPGWAYRDNRLAFGSGDARLARLDTQLDDWNRLTAFGPKDFYIWRSGAGEEAHGGYSYFNRYKWLPDHEHYALFQLFEYYYLTGDRRALDAIHGFVNWDINFQYQSMFDERTRPLEATQLFEDDPAAMFRGHYGRVYTWMLYTNLAGLQATGSPVMEHYARWQLRRLLAVLRDRHGQLTSWHKHKGTLPGDSSIRVSSVQSWMEAQGVLALHEAWKHYRDERILDGLWAQADYFSHHVPFYPELGMVNNRTAMPNRRLGDDGKLTPQRHDRHVQAWPLLHHYTGWEDVRNRHAALERGREGEWTRDWFLQTHAWTEHVAPKHSTAAPAAVTDLRVSAVDAEGIHLAWTAPRDDGPDGRAARYFVKISRKPIVAFAPTDHPDRDAGKQRVLAAAEDAILRQSKNRRRLNTRLGKVDLPEEPDDVPRAHPDWHRVNAFWMAEHVAGEPTPGAAGSRETFTLTEIRPHTHFGLDAQPSWRDLEPGTYYLALCSWDADRNLSRMSNVVEVELD